MSINEREAALNILEDIFINKSYNNLALRNYLKKNPLEQKQKNFITELVNGVLRNYIYLDYVICSFAKASKIKPFILNLLRLSAYQIIYMDKTPDYATINEAVKLCRKRGFHNLSGFVNAVLRKVATEGANVTPPNENSDLSGHLSTVYSIPEWIVKMWRSEYPDETLKEVCKALSVRPEVTICVNTLKTDIASLKEALAAEGVSACLSVHPNALTISNTSDISELKAYKNGYFHVMDISSMMAVDLLGACENESILDLCAAPGGKSFYMAYKYKGILTACDIYPHKLELLELSAKRLGLDITVLANDAKVFCPEFDRKFDNVLVDAPCSGLGLLRKKPDIKLKRVAEDIETLARTQEEILINSAAYVKEGGTLLYCTCTLSKRENRDMVESFLARGGFTLEQEREILPQDHGSDGFYIAKMKKFALT